MTRPRDRRLTESRVTELREEIAERFAELDARVRLLEGRPEVGELLAEELGQAALRTLKRRPQPRREGHL